MASDIWKALTGLLDILKKGGAKLRELFDKISKSIVDWFLNNKKAFALIEKVDDILLPFIKILKDNIWYLKALEKVKGPVINGKHGKENVQVLENNFKSLYEPCPSCKKQIIIRQEM